MNAIAERTRVMHVQAGDSRWEIATRPVPSELAAFVHDWVGYGERTRSRLVRREYPTPYVTVILELGPPLRVVDSRDRGHGHRFEGGFVAGLHDGFAETEHDGFQQGMQLSLTPSGAHRFFGLPMAELTGRSVALRDLLPRAHRTLAERLHEQTGWDARFDVVEALLEQRFGEAGTRLEPVDWAIARILATGGALDIGELVRQIGYSHKQVLRQFRQRAGVAPKLLARIARFDRVLRDVRGGPAAGWAELAALHGYYDQAHLVRDVKQFTGFTPTQLRSAAEELAGLFA